jgi:hypothetical protein
MTECWLEKHYQIKHDKIPELYLKQYYTVGKLFHGRKICAWCFLKLQDFAKPVLTDADAYNMEVWKNRNPEYVKIIDDIGMDTLRFELTKQILEHPYEPQKIETALKTELVGEYEDSKAGNPLPPPKEPKITVD